MHRPGSFSLVVFTALLSSACGSPSPRTERDPQQPATPPATRSRGGITVPRTAAVTDVRPRIVVLGDSLTAGLGLDPSEAYPSLLQARLQADGRDHEIVNAGVSGDTTAGGLRRLEWSLSGDVRVLVVALGGNDGLRGVPVTETRRNLDEIVQRASQRRIKVLLAGMEVPPNMGDPYAQAFRGVFREVAQKHRVALLPFLLDGVAGIPALNQDDGIHPNAAGAQIIANNVWRALQPLLPQRSH